MRYYFCLRFTVIHLIIPPDFYVLRIMLGTQSGAATPVSSSHRIPHLVERILSFLRDFLEENRNNNSFDAHRTGLFCRCTSVGCAPGFVFFTLTTGPIACFHHRQYCSEVVVPRRCNFVWIYNFTEKWTDEKNVHRKIGSKNVIFPTEMWFQKWTEIAYSNWTKE